jgi:hypothetical protein
MDQQDVIISLKNIDSNNDHYQLDDTDPTNLNTDDMDRLER